MQQELAFIEPVPDAKDTANGDRLAFSCNPLRNFDMDGVASTTALGA